MVGMDARDVTTLEDLLRAQWLRLRDWIDSLDLAVDTGPSVLDGWTIAELVAHLGHAMSSVTRTEPAAPGAEPVSLAAHVSGYPGRAEEIAENTRVIARDLVKDPLPGVERMVEEAFARIAALRALGPDPVVIGRRNPLLLSTLLETRLLELVVHADDLARSTRQVTPGALGPLEPGALAVVADTLAGVLAERGGPVVDVVDPVAWMRLACGRAPLDDAASAAAIRPARAGEALPDLSGYLPLL